MRTSWWSRPRRHPPRRLRRRNRSCSRCRLAAGRRSTRSCAAIETSSRCPRTPSTTSPMRRRSGVGTIPIGPPWLRARTARRRPRSRHCSRAERPHGEAARRGRRGSSSSSRVKDLSGSGWDANCSGRPGSSAGPSRRATRRSGSTSGGRCSISWPRTRRRRDSVRSMWSSRFCGRSRSRSPRTGAPGASSRSR